MFILPMSAPSNCWLAGGESRRARRLGGEVFCGTRARSRVSQLTVACVTQFGECSKRPIETESTDYAAA